MKKNKGVPDLKHLLILLNPIRIIQTIPIKSFLMGAILAVIFPLVFGLMTAWAGPPFFTDDPEPAEYKHGEFYFASQYIQNWDGKSATLPHLEFNYGVLPNMHLHLIAPFQYVKPEGEDSQYGYGDTELGIKFRFIQEKEWIPMVGTFPIVIIPTGNHEKGLGSGQTQIYIPLWFQKSWGPWTTYGGGGYWINPGEGNKDWWFFGWLVQREITKQFTLGAELFHRSNSLEGGDEGNGFQVGAIINLTDQHHILLSAGRDFTGPNLLTAYVGYQFTFGFGSKEEKVSFNFKPNNRP
jgi:hypothetical protein